MANKSEFVRSLPANMSAKDVVAKAKEQGIWLTTNHVYTIRSFNKSKGAKATKGAKGRKGKAAKTVLTAKTVLKAKSTRGSKARLPVGALSKKSFVEGLGRDTPAKEVIKLAKKQGLSISTNYVYLIRSQANGSKRKAPTVGGANLTESERQLRRLIILIGFARAQQIANELRASVLKAA